MLTAKGFDGLFKGSSECPTMTIGNISDSILVWPPLYPTLQLTSDSLDNNSDALSSFLTNHFTCLVLLVNHLDYLFLAVKLVKNVENHLIVYSGSGEVSNAILFGENRPIVRLSKGNHTTMALTLGTLYCPTETNVTLPFVKPIVLPNKIGPDWMSSVSEQISFLCPNPLAQQTLIGASFGGDLFIDGTLVGGHFVKLFWYLGEKFNFNAVYKADEGTFNVRTGSFYGMSKKVLKYQCSFMIIIFKVH